MIIRVAGIEIPSTPMAMAADEALKRVAPTLLFGHSVRTFLFAELLAKQRGLTVDHSLLFTAAMFHSVGLLATNQQSIQRYEVDGANAARHFLRQFRVDELEIAQVWDAIALHTTTGIPCHKAPLIALTAAGVEVDVWGYHLADISADDRESVLSAYPREREFKLKFLDFLAEGQAHRPDSTFGTVNADVLERSDPNFRRLNYCGRILGASWQE